MQQFLEILSTRSLDRNEAASAMKLLLDPQCPEAEAIALLSAIRERGETPAELLGFRDTVRKSMTTVYLDDPNAIDMCGTGGGANLPNISTIAAFVVAGAGVTVAKLGNKTVLGTSGSADILSALGIKLDLRPMDVRECVNRHGLGFLFAPKFFPAMTPLGALRKKLGGRSILHMLGPTLNPANLGRQIIGTWNRKAWSCLTETLQALEPAYAYIITAKDEVDEVSLSGVTDWAQVEGKMITVGHLSFRSFCSQDFQLSRYPLQTFVGGTAEANAQLAIRVLSGEHFPVRELVIANAALSLQVAGKIKEGSLPEGAQLAADSIDSGAALKKLEALQAFTNNC